MPTLSPPICVTIPRRPATVAPQPARALLRDLERPVPWLYWTDLLASAGLGWAAVLAAGLAVANDAVECAVVATGVAGLAFYRAAMFIHEISHLRSGALPGFTAAWNLLVGLPLLLPSFMYLGIHKYHHKADTYGTVRDPEYLPLAGVRAAILTSTLVSLLLPLVLAVRFLVAAPLGLLVPRVHHWLERHASALALNVRFERDVNAQERREMRQVELALLVLWWIAFGVAAAEWVPWHTFAIWYAVMAVGCLLNHLRALAAHGYENHAGTPMTRREQLLDSIDTPGGTWTALWAPVGLRYHALHHDFPGIPYHNLPIAYRRLQAHVPGNGPHRRTTSSGLCASLCRLWQGRREDA